jgi:hypothetical protein
MGWTRKSYRDAKTRNLIVLVFFVLFVNAVRVYTVELGLPEWMYVLSYIPLLASGFAIVFWSERRFERSGKPTTEQREAWEEFKKRRNRSLLVLGPGLGASVVLISLPLPWYIAITPFAVSFVLLLFMQRGQNNPTKKFEETLIWFDESWDESPLASGKPGSDP